MARRRTKTRKQERVIFKSWLSHHPTVYALVGGVGVILFWRGAWHSMDYLMAPGASIWWDGPLSLILGTFILLLVGAFVSSLIGNEIILAGLRAEKREAAKEGKEIHNENLEIEEIRHTLDNLSSKLDHLAEHLEK